MLCWNSLSGRVDDRADLRFPFGVVDEELRDASRSFETFGDCTGKAFTDPWFD